ncbi:MAG TPA: hypothetical protein VFT71_05400 [Candidatus Nitrosocosmicus sp.]|nr:hypothetical protein [Candidatus Nitrosocosmicus sp.]
MDKISNYEDERGELHNVESFVLEKLLTQHTSGEDPLVNVGDLIDSVDKTMTPLFDQALENLIAQSLIHCEDGENYEITHEGVKEVENRKKDSIPL